MTGTVITNYKEITRVLADRSMRQALYDEGGVVMDDVLLTLHGRAHHARRVLEFSILRKDYFSYYEAQVFPPALAQVLGPLAAGGRMDLVDFGYRVTMNLTADFAGIDRPEKSADETERLLRLVKIFSEGATLVHSTRDKDAVRAEVRAGLEDLRETFLAPSIARRQAALDQGDADLPRDVLTLLLRDREKQGLSDAVILREMAFFLQAGSHSTANSTVHALHEIFLRWPDVAARARLRQDPIYLQRCVHESFRLHPASPVAWRRPEGSCPRSAEGRVELNFAAANRQQDIFGATADDFDPDRAAPEGVPRWGLTFGFGMHMCLGRDLDGGLPAGPDTDPATHQYGIVTQLVRSLLARDVRPDPENPAVQDTRTQRQNFSSYPVLLNPEPAE
ncbi:MAG: cytochrome P450 [Rhodobacter sp.]|uniref:cytochrome P450 n=1 Tax=Pararhodobacter sp. TaxID=2127056 RepID=UPI001D34F28A|nr:cytochrome P450 [Pararhodobacter sp.]MCB1346714.1 cytochrome P450 [Paracoccaceae bacterium]MCC0074449.1 cytochrome P450 [Rhodobacter sp.]HPD93179.1 cytochrome P450 [Pararhodobacter sp.]